LSAWSGENTPTRGKEKDHENVLGG